MENTLIILSEKNQPQIPQLSKQQNTALYNAGLLDILTEACRLAECNPEMKVTLYSWENNKDIFWNNFVNNLSEADLTFDKHFENYFKRKVVYQQYTSDNYDEQIHFALNQETADEDTEHVILINCHCPMLIGEMLDDAFYYLSENDIVLGGTKKGDLYLLGIHQIDPNFFEKIDFNSDIVYKNALFIAEELKLDKVSLDILDGITNMQDLTKLYEKLRQNGFAVNTANTLVKILQK